MCCVTVVLSAVHELIKQHSLKALLLLLDHTLPLCFRHFFNLHLKYVICFPLLTCETSPLVSCQITDWGTGAQVQLQQLYLMWWRENWCNLFSPPGLAFMKHLCCKFTSRQHVWKAFYHCCRLLEANRFALFRNLPLRSPTTVKIRLDLKDISVSRHLHKDAALERLWRAQQECLNQVIFLFLDWNITF